MALETFLIGPDSRLSAARDGQFDVILCHDVIEHCPDPETSVSEMKRLLKKGGLLYLTTPNRLGLAWVLSDPHYKLPLVAFLPKFMGDPLVKKFRKMDNDVTHMFTLIGLRRLFRNAGLKTVYSYPDEIRAKIKSPEKIKSSFKGRAFALLHKLGLDRLLPPAMPLLHLFSNTFIFILKKD